MTPIVVAELVYVTRDVVGWTRSVIAQRLSALLDADGLTVAEAAVVRTALTVYGGRSRLDFADAYLAASALAVGPAAVASFDSDFDGVEGVRRISA
ncbi:MAG: PIN domain-containing protein [Chloroflexi bacterium]|nr:PIN domain-containing protein [Chloroflexota bacterium]